MTKNTNFSKNDIDNFKKAAKDGKMDEFVNKNLSSEQSAKLKNVLSNKEELEKLLNTSDAKALIKKLLEGK